MSNPEETPQPPPSLRPLAAVEKPRPAGTHNPTREERLAKALRDNLKRRKVRAKKDQA